jgi:hypothetical protein
MKKTKQAKRGDVIQSQDLGSGLWLVEEAGWGGGGTGHGPHDIYPDAWQVCVRKLNADNLPTGPSKSFNQKTNCYSNCIPVVEVVGVWKVVKATVVSE